MPTQKTLSEVFVKCFLFFASIGWIYVDIKSEKQGLPVQDSYLIQFANVKLAYQVERRDVECQNKTVLIAISSTPNAFNLRMAFRKEWAKNEESFIEQFRIGLKKQKINYFFNKNIFVFLHLIICFINRFYFFQDSSVIYRFFVGFTANESVRQANFEESKMYNDIVITSIFDSYITLVFKTYSIFTWQQNFCPDVKYILRSHDNILVSVPRLRYWIENKFDKEYNSSNGKLIFCRTIEHLETNSKYRIKSNNRMGFEYCEDRAYLITSKATKLMLAQALNETIKNSVEDLMFTGLLAEEIGAKRIHSPKHFTSVLTNCGCDENNVPYIISSQSKWEDNSTLISDYSLASQNFLNMSCSKNITRVEFFKACIARTG